MHKNSRRLASIAIGVAVAALLLSPLSARALEFALIDLELGVASSDINDVRIPPESGTAVSLTEDLDADATGFFRLRLGWDLGRGHHLTALVAPLRFASAGRAPRDIDFAGTTFIQGSLLDARYRFDSYRLTYRYDLRRTEAWELAVGFTAKIRAAEISFRSQELRADYANVGFVPLLHARVGYRLHADWEAVLEADALAAPQGRAEDVFLGLAYQTSDQLGLRAGYRLLEGGADVDDVYTFALIHYACFGVAWKP